MGFHTRGGVARGRGARDRSRLAYEVWVVRNNVRFLRKHWSCLRSGRCELRVPPDPVLAALVQAALRVGRAGRKLSRDPHTMMTILSSSTAPVS